MIFETWLTFVVASTALLIIPGPTIVLVMSYALSKGRQVAMATAAGVATGDLIAMTASLAGLGALVMASATLFTIIKWVGAVYLVYLGIKLFMSAGSMTLTPIEKNSDLPSRGIFMHAAAVTALNPKSIAFFIAFVPQFISPAMPLLPQFIILVATFVGLAAINAILYALLADRLRSRITKPSVLAWLSRLGGGALISMGVATAALKRANS